KNMADPKGRIKEIRGIGLMIGVELNTEEGTAIAEACMKEGLLLNCTQGNVLRIMPPINIKKEEADMAIGKLSKVMEHI
ncbi:MAG: aminotransferase class III-fold pyridoxal phosphate-dependent enzyme, partial [Candidatus Omnitrophica bacterium]|nr:aminotransferase class III-fold pyridoxal phosphate-dependent enzyme [Candidatus Omnitrophota bacterium]